MKFQSCSIVAATILGASASYGQGLYNLVPTFDGEEGSSPLQWTLGASLGYDDNVNNGDNGNSAFSRDAEDSMFLNAFVQATYANADARTQWSIAARLGATYFFDETNTGGVGLGANSVNNRINSDSNLNYTLNHRISDRLRFRSTGGVAYQLEPNLQSGLASNRQLGEYLSWSTDNSIGYEINPRFGVVLGYRFAGINYSDFNIEDRYNSTIYTQLRYKASDRTVITGNYRYATSHNNQAADSESHFVTAGIEHRFSPTSVVTFQAGAQFRDSDLGNSNTSPFAELGLSTRLTPQLSARLFSRLMQEDGELASPGLLPGQYGSRLVWRSGLSTSYIVSPELSLNGGLTFISSSWEDGTAGLSDFDEQTLNLNIGFAYQVYSNLTITGSYNYSTTFSDADFREFDRNRFMLGVQTSF